MSDGTLEEAAGAYARGGDVRQAAQEAVSGLVSHNYDPQGAELQKQFPYLQGILRLRLMSEKSFSYFSYFLPVSLDCYNFKNEI